MENDQKDTNIMAKRHGNNCNGNYKRRKNGEDEEEGGNNRQLDPTFGQYRALPISQKKLASVKPDTVPEDAETYLALVRRQAESGSSVMFVKKEISYDDEVLESVSKVIMPIPKSKEQKQYEESIINKFKTQRESLPESGKLEIPSDFIFPENFTEWRRFVMKTQPKLSIISNLDHELTIRLIIYCTRWLNNNIPEQISSWIFALLVKLDNVLESSDAATVRELALRAKKINAKGDVVGQVSRATNDFILVIVSRFFGQRDLEL